MLKKLTNNILYFLGWLEISIINLVSVLSYLLGLEISYPILLSSNNGIGWQYTDQDLNENISDNDIDLSGIDSNIIDSMPKNSARDSRESNVGDSISNNQDMDGRESNHQDSAVQNVSDNMFDDENLYSGSLPSYYEMNSYGVEILPNNQDMDGRESNIEDNISNNQEIVSQSSDVILTNLATSGKVSRWEVYSHNIDQNYDLSSESLNNGYVNILNEEIITHDERYIQALTLVNVPENMYENTDGNMAILQLNVSRSIGHWDNLINGLSHRLGNERYSLNLIINELSGIDTQIINRLEEIHQQKLLFWEYLNNNLVDLLYDIHHNGGRHSWQIFKIMIDNLNGYENLNRKGTKYLLDWLELAKYYRKDGEYELMKLIERTYYNDYEIMDKYKIFYQMVEDKIWVAHDGITYLLDPYYDQFIYIMRFKYQIFQIYMDNQMPLSTTMLYYINDIYYLLS